MITYRHESGSTPGRWFLNPHSPRVERWKSARDVIALELSGGRHGTHGRSAWPSIIIMEVATMGVLVLTRGKLQTVVIDAGDETIEVIVAEIRGDKVKLAFSASKRVQINRPEIREKKLKSAEKDGVS